MIVHLEPLIVLPLMIIYRKTIIRKKKHNIMSEVRQITLPNRSKQTEEQVIFRPGEFLIVFLDDAAKHKEGEKENKVRQDCTNSL